MTGVEGAEQQRGGKEKMRKEREKERERGKKEKALMVSCSHTNTCQVFSGRLADTFWGENKCKEQSGEVEEEEEPRYLNPVWVSSRPWTS